MLFRIVFCWFLLLDITFLFLFKIEFILEAFVMFMFVGGGVGFEGEGKVFGIGGLVGAFADFVEGGVGHCAEVD
jgi:hypothetical protein